MSQDSEKRFHSIMDKLFHSPKSAPSSSSVGVELKRGTKRQNPESALALVEPKTLENAVEKRPLFSTSDESSQAPLCRPWDRGDLMRRLATFKSMTWFAKPKIVSAINCARRGWVNVDTDTIACESCGARLLFSTPSSWTQQQVEKVALVFSLKLDNGHRLLCPWSDNACDETLAHFPPTPPPVLVDKFQERSSALLQLSALPVISSSAIEYMKSPQLDEFLKWFSSNELTDVPQTDSVREDVAAKFYYQAQKLISLCGWEPRSLPYVVECEERVNQPVKMANQRSPSMNVSAAGSHEMVEATDISQVHKSVVLDCRLCGASVGLWAFSVVPRPLEFLRFEGYATANNDNNSGTHDSGNENQGRNREVVANDTSNGTALYKESSPNLGLTIAGGPPPTKQNFKATISLPVIGRSLMAKFTFDNESGDLTSDNQGNDQSPFSNRDVSENVDTPGTEDDVNNLTGEGTTATRRETSSEAGTSCSKESAQNVSSNPSQSDMFGETGANRELDNLAVDSFVARYSSISTPDATFTNRNGEFSRNEKSLMIRSESTNVARTEGNEQGALKDNTTKFDPIRQHRHFCPWIVSTDGRSPGWQQTLSALQRQKDHSHPSPSNSPPSASIIKVDDPLTSVRRLFASPVTKRMKKNNGSS